MDKLAKVRHILKAKILMLLLYYLTIIDVIFLILLEQVALLISNNENKLITDFRYIEQATNQATHFEIVNRRSGIIDEIKEIIKTNSIKQ